MNKSKVTYAIGIYKYLGLMFKKDGYDTPMVFEFSKPTLQPIHTWFCFFDIRCIYYDEGGKVIEDIIIHAWTSEHIPPRPYVKLIEIPISKSKRRSK